MCYNLAKSWVNLLELFFSYEIQRNRNWSPEDLLLELEPNWTGHLKTLTRTQRNWKLLQN